jgi:plastocyanin
MAFHPEELRVQRGDTIVWINRDLVPHSATAKDSSSWTTGIVKQGERAQWVADRRGSLPYFCELHPTMKGSLIVR